MADLDEISHKLGEIGSDIKHTLSWMIEHEKRDQQRFDELQRAIQEHEPVITSVKRFKWMVAGLASFVSLAVSWASSLWGIWRG